MPPGTSEHTPSHQKVTCFGHFFFDHSPLFICHYSGIRAARVVGAYTNRPRHYSGKVAWHTVASSSPEIVGAADLAHRLHVNTVVAQRMAKLHSGLELFK